MGSGIVTLGDIAQVQPASEPNYTLVTSNGRPAVLVNVRQALGGDTVEVVRETQARLTALGLPPGVTGYVVAAAVSAIEPESAPTTVVVVAGDALSSSWHALSSASAPSAHTAVRRRHGRDT